jgi:hypothetical protein
VSDFVTAGTYLSLKVMPREIIEQDERPYLAA